MTFSLCIAPVALAAALLATACAVIPGATPTDTAPQIPTATPAFDVTQTTQAPPATLDEQTSIDLSLVVGPIPHDLPPYDRDEWRHWTDEDGDCQNARQEVLIAESTTAVTYTDADQCRVVSGTWMGPYTGEQFDDPGELDIDRMVPLGNAHRSGGWAWSDDRKRQYANDLSYDGHLIAVQAAANRSKGSDGPEDWKPPDPAYWCQYAIDWIAIKSSWDLSATESEAVALSEMLDTCAPPRALTVIQSDVPQSATTPSPTHPSGGNYDSCEAAEAAGERRVEGSRGSGRGFPHAKVPNTRDGDGDGVVCER